MERRGPLLRLCTRQPHHLAPFLGVVGDELSADLGRRVFGRTEADPLARLETAHEIAYSGNIGSASDRVAVVTAKARSLPALMCSIDAAMSVNVTWICPPSRSVIAGPAPRYGTCVRLTPVIILNSSPVT